MLKVTQSKHDDGQSTYKFEGKLIEPWVSEVRGLFSDGNAPQHSQLDLARVTFVDHAGLEFLSQLVCRGIRIASCSPYVAELLRLRRSQSC